MTSIELSQNLKYINNSAFSGCSSLTEIIIPNSVVWIGNYVFQDCSSLKSVELPASVTTIEDYMGNSFWGCTSIEKLIVTQGSYAEQWAKSIGYYDDILVLK